MKFLASLVEGSFSGNLNSPSYYIIIYFKKEVTQILFYNFKF
jgi:hypothetical protein